MDSDQQLTVVPYRAAGGAFLAERARPWSQQRIADLGASYWSYDLLPRQSGIVALTVPETSRQRERSRLAVVLNLFEELRRNAPAR